MAFLEWMAGYVLSWLLNLLEKKIENAAADAATDKARGETNDKNVKAYEDAQSRKDRIAAALKLLNRDAP